MGTAESQRVDSLGTQNRCGHDLGPGEIHVLIYKWPTDNRAWHEWDHAVMAPEAFHGIVLGVAY
jgi:hypothetical protein